MSPSSDTPCKIVDFLEQVNRISVSVWKPPLISQLTARYTHKYPSSRPDLGQNFHTSPLLIWKSLIGRFYWEELKAMGKILMKMAVLLQGHAFCAWTAMDPSGYFFFEKHSLIDFQIGKGRKREFRAAELRFSLHKEFCAAEIRFYLYKEFSRRTMWQLFDNECSSRSFPLWK